MASRSPIKRRKQEHLDFCLRQPVEFQRKTTWLERVEFVHRAVPKVSPAEVDISTKFLGKRLEAPFIIGAMTGGTAEAERINRRLAEVAAETGVGLALGSQRAMLEQSSAEKSFRVRDIAPDILLLGNLGMAQAAEEPANVVKELMKRIDADGMNLHLNAAMELFQAGGDCVVGDVAGAMKRLARSLGKKLIVKETGCGLSRETARELVELGVGTLDVAGAGGTSWVRVENLRRGGAPDGLVEFEEWGIPTAASLIEMRGLGATVIASGGIRSGVDLAKAVALGAEIGSAALPVLRALGAGGKTGVAAWINRLASGLRTAMALTGCRNLRELRGAPVVFSGPLREWVEQRTMRRTKR